MYTRTGEDPCEIICQSTDGKLICSWSRSDCLGCVFGILIFSARLKLIAYTSGMRRHEWSLIASSMRESSNVKVKSPEYILDKVCVKYGDGCRLMCARVCGYELSEDDRVNAEFGTTTYTLYARPPITEVLALPKFRQHRLEIKTLMISQWLLPDVIGHILTFMYVIMMNDPASYCTEVEDRLCV